MGIGSGAEGPGCVRSAPWRLGEDPQAWCGQLLLRPRPSPTPHLSKSEVRNSLGISGTTGVPVGGQTGCKDGNGSCVLHTVCPSPATSLPGGLQESGRALPRGFPCSRTKGASRSSGGTSQSWLSLRSSRVSSGRWARPAGTEVRRLLCRMRSRKERSPAVGRCQLRASRGPLRATPGPGASGRVGHSC